MPKNTSFKPLVSIIIPIYNDEEFLGRALDSCINQTLLDIEIICVDDASTDASIDVAKKYVKKDDRIKLIKQPKNMSALQARRVGVEAAIGDYILFVDGDDEIDIQTAELCYKKAIDNNADLVGFGATIPPITGRDLDDFENKLLPKHDVLVGKDIIKHQFSKSGFKAPYLWGCLFKSNLLKNTYKYVNPNDYIYRINDQIISFPALAQANKYVSIKQRLYVYNLSYGNSMKKNIDFDKFLFYASGLNSIKVLGKLIDKIDIPPERKKIVRESFDAMKMRELASIASYAVNNTQPKYTDKAVEYTVNNIDTLDLIISISSFKPNILPHFINKINIDNKNKNKKINHIALMVNKLTIGGLEGVAISQSKYLIDMGYKVTILTKDDGLEYSIPKGVNVVNINGEYDLDKLKRFADVLVSNKIDAIIDHDILYNTKWADNVVIAKVLGLKTYGWIHNFALRNAHSLNKRSVYLRKYLSLFDSVITLSKKDVAFWKTLGHDNVFFLPNPPSPLLLDYKTKNTPKKPSKGEIKILWYGRLQQSTKRVYELLKIASSLYLLTDNFKLTIVGPESKDLSYDKLSKRVNKYELNEVVDIVGPKQGQELIKEMNKSDILVYTSDIEGYPLVLTEAQSHGLPVLMYELPWLEVLKDNDGIKQVKWGDSRDMAWQIYELMKSPDEYKKMSSASISAAKKYLSYDFGKLYDNLIKGNLGKEFTVDPSTEDSKLFIEMYEKYNSQNVGKYTLLMKKYESLKESQKAMRRQIKDEKNKTNRIKKSRAYRLGNTVVSPLRYIKRILK